MNAEDVAAFMADDDEVEVRVRPSPRSNSGNDNNAPAGRPVPQHARPAAPRPPAAAAKLPAKQPPVKQAAEVSAEHIRNMLMEEETVPMAAGGKSPRRFEPLSSGIEETALGGGAVGGGFASVLVVGTEERAETMEEQARTFVAYRLEVRRVEGGPYIIYRRYKQFEVLYARCRSHGMAVTQLPPKHKNWFGFKEVDENVVAERVPKLQAWFAHTLSLSQASTCKFLQEWLSPVQLGDISEKNYTWMMDK